MRAMICGISMLAAGSAYAGQSDDIALKAASCWMLPAGADDYLSATFDVALDADGFVTDATVLDHKAEKSAEKIFVLSALRALQKCAPYDGVSGTVRVKLETSEIPPAKGPIDPFK